MKASAFFSMKALITLLLLAIFAQSSIAQTTYTVTSTSVGNGDSPPPGTFLWAVDQANNNPGADIIEFTDGLQVDAATVDVTNATRIMARITESVIIDGKGGALNGHQSWVDGSGLLNPLTHCPANDPDPNTQQVSYMPGFVEIGVYNVDNSGIEVSIKNLTIKQFNLVAKINKNASLIFENFEARDTWATFQCAGEGMIGAFSGGSLTIRNSRFAFAENWGVLEFAPSILGDIDAGDLLIENSVFEDLNPLRHQPTISWNGASGSEVNIVSSRFLRSGGMRVHGACVSNIVNSICANFYVENPAPGDLIINSSSADMNITASSFVWNSNQKDGSFNNTGHQNLIEIQGAGNINFSESALGFNWDAPTGADELNTLGLRNGGSGTFTADVYTWIQPTTQQDAAALKTMTSQPALLTDLFGFNRNVFMLTADWDVEMATPAFPGELIDVIPTGNPLINPIDGSTITLDVVGNSRVDGNGDRDIGALQLGLAPILSVSNIDDGEVSLSWNQPLHHDGFPIMQYELRYSETGSSNWTSIFTPDLSKEVTGLTNGTEYEFELRAIYFDNDLLVPVNGPWSNPVTATPLGPIGTPTVTAVPGDSEVAISWNLPDLGGRDFYAYSILWRIEGTTDFTGVQVIYNPGETNTIVTGLTNGTSYEFAVTVNASGDISEQGTATATPYGPIAAPVVTAVPGDTEVAISWNLPDLNGNVFTAYSIVWSIGGVNVNGYQIYVPGTTSYTVPGLTNGTEYEFSVVVIASPFGESPEGVATATPLHIPIIPISNWALFIFIALVVIVTVIRFKRII